MNIKRSAAGAALAAAAFTAGAAVTPVLSPAVHPAPAHAQAAGNVTVNLVESVGQEWFDRIGDRTATLELIEGVDPDNGQQLQDLDIPKLKSSDPGKFTEAATGRTSGGTATFDVAPGVYLLTVADDSNVTGDDADRRVFYSPIVVVVRSGDGGQTITPKAQMLGITVDPLTACNSPEWREAAAPGTYVEYDLTASVPNLSTDGTIGTYSLDLTLSPGHTVLWEQGDPAMELTAAGPTKPKAQAAAPADGKAAAGVFTAVDKPNVQVLAASRTEEPATKLEAPKVTVRGAGETLEFTENRDYTVKKSGADSASFALTENGLKELARLRASDAATQVDVWVPVRANEKGPWGGGPVRDVILGDLAATVRLTTDGMDHHRAPVTVEHLNHVNVVKKKACFTADGSPTTTPSAPSSPSTSVSTPDSEDGPTSTVTTTVTAPDAATQGGAGSDTGNSSGGQDDSGSAGGAHNGPRGLASTGAAVIGVSLVGALFILLGLFMRRRREDEGEKEDEEEEQLNDARS